MNENTSPEDEMAELTPEDVMVELSQIDKEFINNISPFKRSLASGYLPLKIKIVDPPSNKAKENVMSNPILRIMTWNANGLRQRCRELEVFLHDNHIDIALISETHLTDKDHCKIPGYQAYWTTHPSGAARGGTAILVKRTIKHFLQQEIRKEYFQSTIISITYNNKETNIGAVYCQPRHKISKEMFVEVFGRIGKQFILAGDFNAKHTAWGSRLITPKGHELIKAMNSYNCDFATSNKITYNNKETNIGAVYCPPRHKISKEMFVEVFGRIGKQFILAGDFNAKHTAW